MASVTIRKAVVDDVPLILDFIKSLAEYEKLENEVVADEAILKEWLFEKKKAEVVFACNEKGEACGFALYFYNFSTFLGRAGIYLEDLFVKKEHRHGGFGKALLTYLAHKCCEEGLGRLEWSCLDWNQSAVDFYRSLGAVSMDGWTTFRVTGSTLEELGK